MFQYLMPGYRQVFRGVLSMIFHSTNNTTGLPSRQELQMEVHTDAKSRKIWKDEG
jgi:hypothetical protein